MYIQFKKVLETKGLEKYTFFGEPQFESAARVFLTKPHYNFSRLINDNLKELETSLLSKGCKLTISSEDQLFIQTPQPLTLKLDAYFIQQGRSRMNGAILSREDSPDTWAPTRYGWERQRGVIRLDPISKKGFLGIGLSYPHYQQIPCQVDLSGRADYQSIASPDPTLLLDILHRQKYNTEVVTTPAQVGEVIRRAILERAESS